MKEYTSPAVTNVYKRSIRPATTLATLDGGPSFPLYLLSSVVSALFEDDFTSLRVEPLLPCFEA